MVNVQEWLESQTKYNTLQKRKKVSELNLEYKNEKLESWLDLSEFVNLKKIKCSKSQITKIDVSKCDKLEELYCSKNHRLKEILLPNNKENLKVIKIEYCCQLSPKDLNFFRGFSNLEKLSVDSTKFYGSLEPLKNLNKLKELTISHTEISEGLECLPEATEWLFCCGGDSGGSQYQVRKIQLQLEPFKIPISGTSYYRYDLKSWRRTQLIQLTKEKKVLENKLTKQKEISQEVINKLREENQNLELIYQQQLATQKEKIKELEKNNQQLQSKKNNSWAQVASANSNTWNENNQPAPVRSRDNSSGEEFPDSSERKFFISLFKDLLGSRETIQWDNRESWKEQIERLKSTLASLKGENYDYKKKIEEMVVVNESLERNNKGLNRRLNSLQEQNEELQVQLSDEKTQNVEVTLELEAIKKEVNDLKKHLKIANSKATISQKLKKGIQEQEKETKQLKVEEVRELIEVPPK
ncbi:MAG: hypothetical protein I3273_01765 [Candidatus Moeniiplasma glomeromycotorum]|nr:hypothetical protein [Candidatus Moeniiplasma glomeromycotorum]MCE8167152.1 hypothetical protein [Candidatus Moeniiplasma glomeromycotorum]MCE8168836.1 hypothetical protein [Candidatus Moeniiplasma glomeromycotorum]